MKKSTEIELEKRIESLEQQINYISNRNERVEINKAWETSWTRRFLIILFTYLAIVGYLTLIVHINPWINAVVPAIGFLLSTLTLPYFKKVWEKFYTKEK